MSRTRTFALFLLVVWLSCEDSQAEKRFSRPVIKVADPSKYETVKADDVTRHVLIKGNVLVSSLVYRGTDRYYVEIAVTSRIPDVAFVVPSDFITFTKPGYTVFRTDTIAAAQEIAADAGVPFVPTPAPQMPSNSTTVFNGSATTYGNNTQISGTATTYNDNSAQAGANVGNAIGNAIAAHRFYAAQANERKFSQFLATFAQGPGLIVVDPGQTRIIAATFVQTKNKKAPFSITVTLPLADGPVTVGNPGDTFVFDYKE
jgi:hypothetical protein